MSDEVEQAPGAAVSGAQGAPRGAAVSGAQGAPCAPQGADAQGAPQGADAQGAPSAPQGADAQGAPVALQGADAQGAPSAPQGADAQGAPSAPQGADAQGAPQGSGRRTNRARRIVLGAAVVGFLLIFGATLSRQLELARLERACHARDLRSCFHLCFKAPAYEHACAQVAQACEQGSAAACEAQRTLDRF